MSYFVAWKYKHDHFSDWLAQPIRLNCLGLMRLCNRNISIVWIFAKGLIFTEFNQIIPTATDVYRQQQKTAANSGNGCTKHSLAKKELKRRAQVVGHNNSLHSSTPNPPKEKRMKESCTRTYESLPPELLHLKKRGEGGGILNIVTSLPLKPSEVCFMSEWR